MPCPAFRCATMLGKVMRFCRLVLSRCREARAPSLRPRAVANSSLPHEYVLSGAIAPESLWAAFDRPLRACHPLRGPIDLLLSPDERVHPSGGATGAADKRVIGQ